VELAHGLERRLVKAVSRGLGDLGLGDVALGIQGEHQLHLGLFTSGRGLGRVVRLYGVDELRRLGEYRYMGGSLLLLLLRWPARTLVGESGQGAEQGQQQAGAEEAWVWHGRAHGRRFRRAP
jgi:hypothetical protein